MHTHPYLGALANTTRGLEWLGFALADVLLARG